MRSNPTDRGDDPGQAPVHWELDKVAMGGRIKQIRLRAGLRQWELARKLGTTQSAVHKYEHGVVPEPRRLVVLARIGRTSIEWILTGRHWENGSADQERLTPEVLDTAQLLRQIKEEDRASVDEALRIVRAAVEALGEGKARADEGPEGAYARGSGTLSRETSRLLEAAWRIQRAVLLGVLQGTTERLTRSPMMPGDDKPSE